jgi:NADPH-dependent 2,4-dienoyl-CoA reductase/sulfur reductase-like enzyme
VSATESFRYILVGGGMAAAAAVQGIRRHDKEGSIALFSQDRYPPYSRPPLSKGLWQGKRMESIWRYEDPGALGITEHLATSVAAIDPSAHRIRLQDSRVFGYGKLLIATGGTPRRLPGNPNGVLYLRGLDDYLALNRAARRDRFLVIGGGFIGAEIACALRGQGKEVRMVFPEDAILAALLPEDLSQAVTRYYREKGVQVEVGRLVEEVREAGDHLTVTLDSGEDLVADTVVAGLGIRPAVDLAQAAGLDVDDGIIVDSRGRTSDPDIYAAGDVARFPVSALGKSLRVEHEDNAVSRGRSAGANMAGQDEAMESAPFFYSDLFDLGFEAVGILDSHLATYADWVEPYRKGVLYYLLDGRVQGVLNWNVWDRVDAARALLGAGPYARPEHLKGQIPIG